MFDLVATIMSYANATTVLVLVFSFLGAYRWYKRPSRFPPGPRGIPLLGVVPFFGRSPDKYFARWSKKCGPVISARMGVADNVILNDYESIQEAFVKHGDNLSGRPAIKVFEEMSDGHGVVMIDYGEKWKSQRQFGITTLRGFGVGRRSMEDRCVEESAYLNEQLLSYGGKPFDVTHVVMNAVANNICSVVFGRRFDYDDDMFRDLIDRATRTFNDPFHSVMINMAILIPWLMYIPPFSTSCKTMLADIHVVLSRMQSIVDQHKTDYDANDIRDFIDKFLQEMKRDDRGHFTNLQLLQYLRDLFQAGTETTTTTLKWALLCLLHYPETQRKLFDEISNAIGNDGEINFTLKARMPYTCAFIQEVYRFRTLVPLCVPHKANRDIELRGFIIPQGTTVLANLWAVHNDSDTWREPDKFQPERHLDSDGNFSQSCHVIPFSVGPRHCLGEQLARMEIFIFLVAMVQRFEFSPDPGDAGLPVIDDGALGAVFAPAKFKIVATQRK